MYKHGVEGWLLLVIKNMYVESKTSMRINVILRKWIRFEQGIRQGCVISPCLFNVFMDGWNYIRSM